MTETEAIARQLERAHRDLARKRAALAEARRTFNAKLADLREATHRRVGRAA